jgi:hypothetical protein
MESTYDRGAAEYAVTVKKVIPCVTFSVAALALALVATPSRDPIAV